MRQARQSTGTRLILGHSRPCVVFSGKQAFASICYSSDSKSERFHRIKRTVCVRRLCRSTAPECSSKRMQPVMFGLEAPDIKRGIAALKYIKIINNLLRPLESPMAAKRSHTRPLAVLREARCARSLLHITGSKKYLAGNRSAGDERWMEECLRASYTVKPLSYLSRNGEFLVTGAAFPASRRRCHSRLAVSFATFQKIRHRIPAGL